MSKIKVELTQPQIDALLVAAYARVAGPKSNRAKRIQYNYLKNSVLMLKQNIKGLI